MGSGTTMADLKVLHRQHWFAATMEEWMERQNEVPGNENRIPIFVEDNLREFRDFYSPYEEAAVQEFLRAANWPEAYAQAIRDYVHHFPMDTSPLGEDHSN